MNKKLKHLFFYFLIFLFPAVSVTGQISMDIKKQSIRQVLRSIENKSDYKFFYSSLLIEMNKQVSVKFVNQPIEIVLQKILTDTQLVYEKKENNQFVIYERPQKQIGQANPADNIISGKVVDENEEPVIGANVSIKGTMNGTTTDVDGNFSLSAKSGQMLFVTFIGYLSKEVKITTSQSVYQIKISEDIQNLEEVVVVGYGTQKKVSLTGSVFTLKSDKITTVPSTNISNMLGGQVTGVISKQSSGEPGRDGASISIRGFGGALVIVDGIESSMSNLDPNEIETITVLKDASAAIYGARAGNGVILITTKRGKISKPVITLNSTISFQSVTQFPKTTNAAQYSELIREAQLNSNTPESGMKFSEEDVRKFREGTEPGYQGWDWWEAVMKDMAPMHQHNLSMSGGNEQFKYSAFLGYTGQYGMYRSRDNKLDRYNMRANLDGNVNKYLSISLDMSMIISDVMGLNRAQAHLWSDIFSALPTLRTSLPDPTKVAWAGSNTSPIASTTIAQGGYNSSLQNQLSTTFSATYQVPVVPGLSVKGMVNYIQRSTEGKVWSKNYDMYQYDEAGDIYTLVPGAFETNLSESYNRSKTITGQISANYNRIFANKHSVSALALIEMMDYYGKNMNAARSGYVTEAIDQLFAGGTDNQKANGSASEDGRLSYIGRVNYGYADRYLAEVTLRYDGSPKFPEGQRWGLFPSVSLGWRISEEAFLKERTNWLDNLKLRVSLSSAGYDGIGAFQYLTGYNFGGAYIVDQTSSSNLYSKGLANLNITWEEMKVYNAGVDFSLFSGKLYGEVDVFYRERYNMLAKRSGSLPNTFGASLPSENINSMNNRGVEILLGHKAQYGDVGLDIAGNITWTRAKWDHYEEPEYTDLDDIRINKVSGNWANRSFGYQSDGLFVSQEEIKSHTLDQDQQGNKTLQPGDIKYIDQNSDGKLDWRDKVEIGFNNDPELMFGLNVAITYKGFDLSALFQGAARRSLSVTTGIDNLGNTKDIIYNERWTEQDNDKWAIIPRQYIGGKDNNKKGTDYWLKDASYLRLKMLSVGYNLPSSFLSKLLIEHARFYLSATNLFTISGLNKYNVDPEGQGLANYYPQQKLFTVGLNLKF